MVTFDNCTIPKFTYTCHLLIFHVQWANQNKILTFSSQDMILSKCNFTAVQDLHATSDGQKSISHNNSILLFKFGNLILLICNKMCYGSQKGVQRKYLIDWRSRIKIAYKKKFKYKICQNDASSTIITQEWDILFKLPKSELRRNGTWLGQNKRREMFNLEMENKIEDWFLTEEGHSVVGRKMTSREKSSTEDMLCNLFLWRGRTIINSV